MKEVVIRLAGQVWYVTDRLSVLAVVGSAKELVKVANDKNLKIKNKNALNSHYSSQLRY